jgi:hypothetical protein
MRQIIAYVCALAILFGVVPPAANANPAVIQHVHDSTVACTTSDSVGATCSVTITWPVAFVDTNYTVVCSPQNGTGSAKSDAYFYVPTSGRTVTSVKVYIETLFSLHAYISGVDCIAMHN